MPTLKEALLYQMLGSAVLDKLSSDADRRLIISILSNSEFDISRYRSKLWIAETLLDALENIKALDRDMPNIEFDSKEEIAASQILGESMMCKLRKEEIVQHVITLLPSADEDSIGEIMLEVMQDIFANKLRYQEHLQTQCHAIREVITITEEQQHLKHDESSSSSSSAAEAMQAAAIGVLPHLDPDLALAGFTSDGWHVSISHSSPYHSSSFGSSSSSSSSDSWHLATHLDLHRWKGSRYNSLFSSLNILP